MRLWCSNYLKVWFPLAVIRPGEVSLPIPLSNLGAAAATIATMDSQSHSFLRSATTAAATTSSSSSLYSRIETTAPTNTTEIHSTATLPPNVPDLPTASTSSTGKPTVSV